MGKVANRNLINTKEPLINAIKKKLTETELPKEFMLEDWAKVTDVKKFFDSHLSVVLNGSEKSAKPYAERLKKGLKIVGININELSKQLKTQKK
jgi:hypothetical protein